jgi:hypothetical protein
MCGFMGIEKNDEMNEKSEEFFKIFQSFFKQIENSLPKQQSKKPPAAGANRPGGVNPLMAELMAK